MRYIDTLDLRWHKGEPTWEIIDELLEHIDSLAGVTPEEFDEEIEESYHNGREVGYNNGYTDGKWDAGD